MSLNRADHYSCGDSIGVKWICHADPGREEVGGGGGRAEDVSLHVLCVSQSSVNTYIYIYICSDPDVVKMARHVRGRIAARGKEPVMVWTPQGAGA